MTDQQLSNPAYESGDDQQLRTQLNEIDPSPALGTPERQLTLADATNAPERNRQDPPAGASTDRASVLFAAGIQVTAHHCPIKPQDVMRFARVMNRLSVRPSEVVYFTNDVGTHLQAYWKFLMPVRIDSARGQALLCERIVSELWRFNLEAKGLDETVEVRLFETPTHASPGGKRAEDVQVALRALPDEEPSLFTHYTLNGSIGLEEYPCVEDLYDELYYQYEQHYRTQTRLAELANADVTKDDWSIVDYIMRLRSRELSFEEIGNSRSKKQGLHSRTRRRQTS